MLMVNHWDLGGVMDGIFHVQVALGEELEETPLRPCTGWNTSMAKPSDQPNNPGGRVHRTRTPGGNAQHLLGFVELVQMTRVHGGSLGIPMGTICGATAK